MKTPDMSYSGERPEGPRSSQLSAETGTGTPGRLRFGPLLAEYEAFPEAETVKEAAATAAAAAARPEAQVVTDPECDAGRESILALRMNNKNFWTSASFHLSALKGC